MAASIAKYDHLDKLVWGGLDLLSDTIQIRLVGSGYTFSASHTQWDNGANDATDPSFNEVSAGGGYSTNGVTLSGASASNDRVTYDDAYWASLTKTFRYAIGVAVGTFGGVVNPVLFCILPDSTPADTTVGGTDYSLLWDDTDGLFYRP